MLRLSYIRDKPFIPKIMEIKIKRRTKEIGLQIIHLVDELPSKPSAWVLSKQIIRSSTSIGANYRAACRAKSNPDFIYKLKIVEEETDETLYWQELLQETGLIKNDKLAGLKKK